jgi:hypothetical protein
MAKKNLSSLLPAGNLTLVVQLIVVPSAVIVMIGQLVSDVTSLWYGGTKKNEDLI